MWTRGHKSLTTNRNPAKRILEKESELQYDKSIILFSTLSGLFLRPAVDTSLDSVHEDQPQVRNVLR